MTIYYVKTLGKTFQSLLHNPINLLTTHANSQKSAVKHVRDTSEEGKQYFPTTYTYNYH